jgi:hypothetical protein
VLLQQGLVPSLKLAPLQQRQDSSTDGHFFGAETGIQETCARAGSGTEEGQRGQQRLRRNAGCRSREGDVWSVAASIRIPRLR